eukprot:945335-Amphidinium_carterae.1
MPLSVLRGGPAGNHRQSNPIGLSLSLVAVWVAVSGDQELWTPGPARPSRWLQPGLASPSERQALLEFTLSSLEFTLRSLEFPLSSLEFPLSSLESALSSLESALSSLEFTPGLLPAHEPALVLKAGVSTVWTDGSGRHSSNPHFRRCGVGYVTDTGERCWMALPGCRQSVLRAELLAVVRALEECQPRRV